MNEQILQGKPTGPLAEMKPERQERFDLPFAIEVCGFDRCGRFFSERTETCDVSDGGCKFFLRTEMDRDGIVALRVLGRSRLRGNDSAPVLFQIARMERHATGWTAGAFKLQRQDVWRMQPLAPRGAAPGFE
ncbi:MAG: hypothetical protein WA192_05995 [Candidatus Acidiferrales bacterium]